MRNKRADSEITRFTLPAIVAVTVLAYAPSLTAGFTADDFFILARLKAANGLQHAASYFGAGFFDYYRPLAFVSHAIDWTLWGAEAFGFHLTNVFLHAGSTVLVWLLARRLFDEGPSALAALLFGLHPASHEAVYWIAARFDLMATFFTLLSLLCLIGRSSRTRAGGWIAFALALLSKESAVSLLLIAPAWDVWVERRDARTTLMRLLPLLVIAAGYLAVRSVTSGVAVTGGAGRFSKMLVLALALAGIIAAAWWRDRFSSALASTEGRSRIPTAVLMVLGAIAILLMVPATSGLVSEKLGFIFYSTFYAVTPVIQPALEPSWFAPHSRLHAAPGLAVLALIALAVAGWRQSLESRPGLVFLLVFIASALLPVSSMVGGLRYLYLASAGVAILIAALVRHLTGSARRLAMAVLLVVFSISASQLFLVGRTWQWASAMTRDGVMLMADTAQPCGQKDVLLLTTPVGIGDVYGNFYYEAFDVLTGCSPKRFTTLLRVVRTDAEVHVTRPDPGVVEMRVPGYTGNILASSDLRNFDHRVEPGSAANITTPAGRLVTFPEGNNQVFRLTMTSEAGTAEHFYYSAGRVRPAPRR